MIARLLCRFFGHRPELTIPAGRTFERDGVLMEAPPAEPPRIECRRCQRRLRRKT